jgi:hypothetical protein
MGLRHVHYPRHLVNILQVCQQTYAESRLLVFRLNQYIGDHLAMHGHVDKVLTIEQRSEIHEVHLEIPHNDIYHPISNKIIFSGAPSLRPALRYISGLQGLRKIVLVHVYNPSEHRLLPSDVANIKWKLGGDIQGEVDMEFVQELRDVDVISKFRRKESTARR